MGREQDAVEGMELWAVGGHRLLWPVRRFEWAATRTAHGTYEPHDDGHDGRRRARHRLQCGGMASGANRSYGRGVGEAEAMAGATVAVVAPHPPAVAVEEDIQPQLFRNASRRHDGHAHADGRCHANARTPQSAQCSPARRPRTQTSPHGRKLNPHLKALCISRSLSSLSLSILVRSHDILLYISGFFLWWRERWIHLKPRARDGQVGLENLGVETLGVTGNMDARRMLPRPCRTSRHAPGRYHHRREAGILT